MLWPRYYLYLVRAAANVHIYCCRHNSCKEYAVAGVRASLLNRRSYSLPQHVDVVLYNVDAVLYHADVVLYHVHVVLYHADVVIYQSQG